MTLDLAIRDVLSEDSACNWWIIMVRDPGKRKNAKPVDTMFIQGTHNVLDAIEETVQACRRGADLNAVTVEARRMTEAEIAKWDRAAAKWDRKVERANKRDGRP